MLLALQEVKPFIVTVVDTPSHQTSFADVLIGAFGLTGALVGVAVVAGAVLALGIVVWHKRHRPEDDHLPRFTS